MFRKRFRVPFELFDQIVVICKNSGQFDSPLFDVTGRGCVPLEIKILGVLRVLGRGSCFDDIAELTKTSITLHNDFFHKFCAYFATLKAQYIYPPTSPSDMAHGNNMYNLLGLPGCVGSVDCVHIPWDRCPARYRSYFANGKNGIPTIAYEVTVDHTHKIISTTTGFYGTMNDKTIVRFDGFIQQLHRREIYQNETFKLECLDGSILQKAGRYVINDNEYHRWCCTMSPIKISPHIRVRRWSRFVEAVRKDVECVFGSLKKRFRFLKCNINIQSKSSIDNAFVTCCILHNMLLSYDGLDKRWDVDSEAEVGMCDEEEESVLDRVDRRTMRTEFNGDVDLSEVGRECLVDNDVDVNYDDVLDFGDEEIENKFFELQDALITHWNIKRDKNPVEVTWLR